MEAKIKELSIDKARDEPKKAPILLMEDNLTKAKRAQMAPHKLCPTGLNSVQSIERKNNIGEKDQAPLSKLRDTMIKKSRDYCTSFPKYSGNSKQGKTWCANICYHALDYRVDTIAAEVGLGKVTVHE